MARDVDPSCSTGAGSARAEAECSGSIEEHCLPSQFSKPYLMYSETDATSAAVDFAKGSLEDGVVNSPPSWNAARLPVCSPSPLRDFTYSSEAAVLQGGTMQHGQSQWS
jgi:hypothetical protein